MSREEVRRAFEALPEGAPGNGPVAHIHAAYTQLALRLFDILGDGPHLKALHASLRAADAVAAELWDSEVPAPPT